ncbi:helix-turn-helix domain-containing protein [Achromobacter xylosoxidans]|uniref:helix-turn-helix domain-containing protein n=1 Tax=Alcaligenes xylosoxydans xylosoxydans TaxID=85698 RepID=UPI000B4915ED
MSHCQGATVVFSKELFALGGRIRELRAGLSQADFAAQLGVDRKTVTRWEAGERTPDGASLVLLIRNFGADPRWLLLGEVEDDRLRPSQEEARLISAFRAMDARGRAAVLGMINGLTHGKAGVVVTGDVSQVNNGPVTQQGVTFNVGRRK